MPIVVGVSLRTAGKIYFFDPGDGEYFLGERVLVETARGAELGSLRLPAHEVSDEQVVAPLKPVIRRATADDIARDAANRDREAHAVEVCKRLVEQFNLPMRLIDAQFTFDGAHVLIHFFSENRVDFRELVRELARDLRCRIELRQVGVRDEAKLLGGFGICGRTLCCSTFLSNFSPVAINMAKAQGLALNPQKISGTCGRLMCCLAYEYDHYRDAAAALPRVNAQVQTPQGMGKVVKLNVLSGQVEVYIPGDTSTIWYTAAELGLAPPQQPQHSCCGAAGACGGCGHHNEAEGDETPEPAELITAAVDDDAEVGADAATEDNPARRRRRRRKKPAGVAGTEASASPKPVVAEGAPGEGTAPAKRRRRPRGARPPRPEGQPAPVPAMVGGPDNGQPAAPRPSARYRPKRRRGGGNRPPAAE